MAIILPHARPAIQIANGTFSQLTEPWLELEKSRAVIEHALGCVGRLETSDKTYPFLSTAFLVAESVILTTRHVVETFAVGIGDKQLRFRDDRKVWINFKAEKDEDESDCAAVTQILFIHPYWDVAALRIEDQRPYLSLQTYPPEKDTTVVAVGYPAFDMRNDADLQYRIFAGVFNRKTLMPARIHGETMLDSYGRSVRTISHDASTLGGTTGAPPLYRLLQTACYLRDLFPEHARLLALFRLVAGNEFAGSA